MSIQTEAGTESRLSVSEVAAGSRADAKRAAEAAAGFPF
jgi:hypothetical protein